MTLTAAELNWTEMPVQLRCTAVQFTSFANRYHAPLYFN